MGGATRFMTLLTTPFPPLRPSLILLHRRISSLSTTPLRLHALSSPSKTKTRTPQPVNSFHSQPNNNAYAIHSSAQQQQHHHHHPWPEWTHFLNILSNGQGFSAAEGHKIPPEDAFVVYEQLPDEFVSAASACIAFARARPNLLGSLSRRDIEAVVSNGTPFLFKSALDTARRLRAFLGTDGSNVSQVDKANTIDLMKYIISYASNPTTSERNGLYSRELVDSSVRNLLHELGTSCAGVPTGHATASGRQFPDRDGHVPKPFGQNIEMKRGDWICQKCNFMNFARNMKCLECEEPRPKKQLTAGEWECPQCNFFNYGRNLVCLRCDCRRPGAPLFNSSQNIGTKFSPQSQSGSANFQYSGSSNTNHVPFVPLPADAFSRRDQNPETSDVSNRPTTSSISQGSAEDFQFPKDSASQIDTQNRAQEQTEKSERWFKRMAELHNVKDLPSAVSDEDFPEIMPMRKGENRFVVSKKKDRSLTSPQYKRQVAMDQANNTNFVPFVPFPPGYFAKNDTEQSNRPDSPVKSVGETSSSKTVTDTEKLGNSQHGVADSSAVPMKVQNTMSSVNSKFPSETRVSEVDRIHNQPMSSTSQFSGGNLIPPSGITVQSSVASHTISSNASTDGHPRTGNPQPETGGSSSQLPRNENARSGWAGPSLEGSAVKEPDPLDMSEEAKAERWFKRVAQIKDISELSQIPDEDFPSIMPMRKGVNRFVVSKRKTPLERRLTSQQYRRNLPIVTNDPVKKDSDNS